MQLSAPDRAAFIAALDAEVAGYTELCELLRAEQDSLERGDVDHLPHLTELKARQVERLAILGATRAAHLQDLRLTPDRAGMEAWMHSHAGAQRPALAQTWRRLLEAAREARKLNELNGGLVAMRLNHSQAGLAALHAAARQDQVYGPDGRVRYPGSGIRDQG